MTEVRGGQLKNKTITKQQIGDKEVTSQQIADETITNAQIAANAQIAQSKIDGLVQALADKLSSTNSTVPTLTITNPPANPTDAVNKSYVDLASAASRLIGFSKNFNLVDANLNPLHAPISTDILAQQTLSVFNEVDNFSTIGHSNYSVYTNTVAVSVGSKYFLYQLGGSQGTQATEIRNVSRAELASNGTQSAWTIAGVADLPEPSAAMGKGAILETTLGKHILFAKGKSDNIIWKSQPINETTGDITGWELLTPLPENTGNPEIVVCDFSGSKVGYILANKTGGSSELIIAEFDGVGDVTNYTVDTIPQSITGKLVALSNQYLYIFGTGVDSSVCFIGTINPTTKAVSWESVATQLPPGLTDYAITLHEAQDGTNKIYIYGGSLAGVLQNTIYSIRIEADGGLFPVVPSVTTLEAPTAGMAASNILIGSTEYTYLTGGRRLNGFIDNSTYRAHVTEQSYYIVRRIIDAGAYYHVNNNEDSRSQTIFVLDPAGYINQDPTLSKPINIFYYARKSGAAIDYVIETAVDPEIPKIHVDKEHLLIRIDQLDPLTGVIKTIPIVTTPITTLDYLDNQKLITQIFNFNPLAVSSTATSITFNPKAFKLGNIRYVFESQAQTITGLTEVGSFFVYWSNYDIIYSPVELEGKILLGFINVNGTSNIEFTPASLGLSKLFEPESELATNGELVFVHGFNTKDLSIQVWTKENSELVLDNSLKVSKIGLNTIKIKNTTQNPIVVDHLFIKKEG